MTEPAKAGTSSTETTTPLLEVPPARTSERQASPVRLSTELILKVQNLPLFQNLSFASSTLLVIVPSFSSLELVAERRRKLEELHCLTPSLALTQKCVKFFRALCGIDAKALANILPSFNAAPLEWPHLTKLTLADPDFLTPRPVDIIIGAVSYGQIIKPNIIKRDTLMPIAQLSIFGWLVLGPVDISSPASAAVHHASIQEREDALDELLSKFWTQEEVPASTNHDLTPDEKRWRYTVRIPLKLSPNTLSDSYLTAHRCLQSLLRRLSRDDNYRRLYHQFMTEYRELNHMKKASPASSQHTQYYLPHHGVLKPDSATTKLRVVFNGSSASTSGRSLNDLMHTGAKLHLDITDGLLWIRQVRHLVATDITKMYRQINVHENDWDIQRILWIDDQLNEVPHYLTTVTYETNAAPFLSVQTLL
ncbi:uncharacterized protein [Temnothorax longispinosus]|uniref:uncharacterized protein n=1 Tax=Temnothorax longispinosus TaxID=300112 RepID=UPI003A9925FA